MLVENNHKSSLELITFVDQYTINWLSHLKTNTQLTTFKSKTGFDNHSNMHTGKNLHICLKCDKQFTSNQILNRHLKIHERENMPALSQ